MKTILEEKDNLGNMTAKASERIKLENMLNEEESKDGTTGSIRYLFRESKIRYPPNSQDLMSIEMIWNELKNSLNEQEAIMAIIDFQKAWVTKNANLI
ncbi:hypothetical protein BpHYR1_028012 [Brachionus plicatilis]|uniref:Uncharacterized protein n=1 Tax=Brachionus plicatilis TaxID=10195 RepID=A0A3M7RLG6_BRAPC|nr:hypothetical protein BpHYR1_028012 [Brachionus plicatilis]